MFTLHHRVDRRRRGYPAQQRAVARRERRTTQELQRCWQFHERTQLLPTRECLNRMIFFARGRPPTRDRRGTARIGSCGTGDTGRPRPLESHVSHLPADRSNGAFTSAFATNHHPRMCSHPRPHPAFPRPAHGDRRDGRRARSGTCGIRSARSATACITLSAPVAA